MWPLGHMYIHEGFSPHVHMAFRPCAYSMSSKELMHTKPKGFV